MNKILTSFAVVILAGAIITAGATTAFFNDTETSVGNTFAAGALDLKVDNDSYYNGNHCVDIGEGVWQWEGDAPYPVPGTPCTTSWTLDDLDKGFLFFSFNDLKPGDDGEDTISLHVQNNAWACMDLTLTSNDDNSSTEPELGDGDTENDLQDEWDGELAQNLNFVWWADDGDNVLEDNENILTGAGTAQDGVENLYALATSTGSFSVALADAEHNVWTGVPGPMLASNDTYFIGKAWCMGELTLAPLTAGTGVNPSVASGVSCDGSLLDNLTQTDGATLDVQFTAEQSRNNASFLCKEGQPCTPSESNIFVNGGFETPIVTDASLWDVFPAAVTGWTIAWRSDVPTSFNSVTRPEPGNLELHSGVLGAAHSGSQYAELDSDWNGHVGPLNGEPASSVISQTITTIPGASYSIEYYFAPRPNTPAADNKVEARFNGVLLDTAGPLAGGAGNLTVGSWIHRGPFVIVATSTSAVVSFTDAGTANSQGSFIDDVSVLQTICPAPAAR